MIVILDCASVPVMMWVPCGCALSCDCFVIFLLLFLDHVHVVVSIIRCDTHMVIL